MNIILAIIPWILIITPPLGILCLGIYIDRRMATRKAPVSEKMLRPAGESVRLKLEHYEGKIFELIVWLLLVPILIGMMLVYQTDCAPWLKILLLLVGLGSFGWGLYSFRKILGKIFNHRLGFRGERFVGGLLENLREHGYRVFHDLPFDRFNIDHVLVGPGGVFAIETKTRRKRVFKTDKKGKLPKVIFDGQVLQYPHGQDPHGIEQACNNARHLATHLSGATGEKIFVEPILVLPGWWVESTTNQPLLVLNPKQLITLLPRRPQRLDPTQIQRIGYQLERMAEMEF